MARKAMTANAYATAFGGPTPQTQAIPGREAEMEKNSAGGVTFTVTPFQMLDRFLILGSDSPTYYASAKDLTKNNSENIRKCLALDWKRTIDQIVEISVAGRAPKNDPALFALAVACTPKFGTQEAAQYALSQLQKVARTGTHLYHFLTYLKTMRGYGRSVKSAVGNWFTQKSPDQLAYQLCKYNQRDGWSVKDTLALAHVRGANDVQKALLSWANADRSTENLLGEAKTWNRQVRRWKGNSKRTGALTQAEIDARRAIYQNAYDLLTGADTPKMIAAFEGVQKATTAAEVVRYITDAGLTHEMIPTQFKNSPEVWEALLQKMPLGAMVRNLGVMSKVGLLTPLSNASKIVVSRLHDVPYIKKSRLHPLNVLIAQATYRQGRGMRGDSSWTVVQPVVDALEDTFYLAFDNVVPTGKGHYFGIDFSGSMGSPMSGSPLSCREAATALALVGARTEQNYVTYGFDNKMVDLKFTAKDTLATAMAKARNWGGGSTDCSLPMIHAKQLGIKNVGAFVVLTDSETYTGRVQPVQALQDYRKYSGQQDARLIVVGMTATKFTIADPKDPYMLDVVGFDTNVPTIMADFVRGGSAGIAGDEE